MGRRTHERPGTPWTEPRGSEPSRTEPKMIVIELAFWKGMETGTEAREGTTMNEPDLDRDPRKEAVLEPGRELTMDHTDRSRNQPKIKG